MAKMTINSNNKEFNKWTLSINGTKTLSNLPLLMEDLQIGISANISKTADMMGRGDEILNKVNKPSSVLAKTMTKLNQSIVTVEGTIAAPELNFKIMIINNSNNLVKKVITDISELIFPKKLDMPATTATKDSIDKIVSSLSDKLRSKISDGIVDEAKSLVTVYSIDLEKLKCTLLVKNGDYTFIDTGEENKYILQSANFNISKTMMNIIANNSGDGVELSPAFVEIDLSFTYFKETMLHEEFISVFNLGV